MKIVVDTNIIFSALLNSNSTIGYLLFNAEKHFEFYSCSYMRYEIQKHWERLKKISKLSEEQLQISYTQVVSSPKRLGLAKRIKKQIDKFGFTGYQQAETGSCGLLQPSFSSMRFSEFFGHPCTSGKSLRQEEEHSQTASILFGLLCIWC